MEVGAVAVVAAVEGGHRRLHGGQGGGAMRKKGFFGKERAEPLCMRPTHRRGSPTFSLGCSTRRYNRSLGFTLGVRV